VILQSIVRILIVSALTTKLQLLSLTVQFFLLENIQLLFIVFLFHAIMYADSFITF
jgi:hypothetical protein